MAVLSPMLQATVGTPQPVVAPPRRRRPSIGQAQFYEQMIEEARPKPQTGEQFVDQPMTGEYLQSQLARTEAAPPPPSLQPGERVRSPAMELVQPGAFRQFYEQLSTTGAIGEEQVGAEQARSQFREMARLQEIMSQQVPAFQGAQLQYTGSGPTGGGVPSSPRANFRYAQQVAPKFGWNSKRELGAWYTLGMKESGWNNLAQNPTSTAFGIGQFLNSTWGNYGFRKSSDPQYQVNAMAAYIRARYGSPSNALAFHRSRGWY